MTPLNITVDTREQTPWTFPPEYANVRRGTITSGDYSLAGDEAAFSIERKTLNDYVGTIAGGWDRFQRELGRMADAQYTARIVIVEATLDDVLHHRYDHPRCLPPFVLKRTAQLLYCGVAVVFAGNSAAAAGMCLKVLQERQESMPYKEIG